MSYEDEICTCGHKRHEHEQCAYDCNWESEDFVRDGQMFCWCIEFSLRQVVIQ